VKFLKIMLVIVIKIKLTVNLLKFIPLFLFSIVLSI
jgi:hypothetical protein